MRTKSIFFKSFIAKGKSDRRLTGPALPKTGSIKIETPLILMKNQACPSQIIPSFFE
jgi:hypothetical protein